MKSIHSNLKVLEDDAGVPSSNLATPYPSPEKLNMKTKFEFFPSDPNTWISSEEDRNLK